MKKTKAAVGLAGAALATAAGIAAAVQYLKSRGGPTLLHVQANGEGWEITPGSGEDAIGVFDTKRKAVRKARRLAADAAPSQLVIHRADGSEQRTHTYDGD